MDEIMRSLAEYAESPDGYSELLERFEDSNPQVRLASLRTMSQLLCTDDCNDCLDEMMDETSGALRNIILGSASKDEHDEALNVLCNISLTLLHTMDPVADPIIRGLLARLPPAKKMNRIAFSLSPSSLLSACQITRLHRTLSPKLQN